MQKEKNSIMLKSMYFTTSRICEITGLNEHQLFAWNEKDLRIIKIEFFFLTFTAEPGNGN